MSVEREDKHAGSGTNAAQSEREKLEIHLLLEGIYSASGFDFRNYARSSLRRRIYHRMQLDGLLTVTSLLEKALHEPGYLDLLVNDFSIKVTEMFRDPSFFRLFRQRVVPELRRYPEIRIWHAGCATGEEAYSMAILLQEEGLLERTKLYGTDMNEQVVRSAREGRFPLKRMQAYTKNYLQAGGAGEFSSYYSTNHEYALFDPSIKANITFAQHNLATDRSFNEFHVILCRNVLIYFDAVLQRRSHGLFYDSLAPEGFIGLGHMETMAAAYKAKYEEWIPPGHLYRKK
ncbi:CheR family methyltransferase [Paenibacillus arenilitoris]|uniref:CheR family methyltransferase n=1 Tax=Paenibacillus arenilitoris TaxID=2772299 RepID=UPI001CC24857|nr:protein-glutamate O-methyltransferase CheR [Paenibacillus arenilitoris]